MANWGDEHTEATVGNFFREADGPQRGPICCTFSVKKNADTVLRKCGLIVQTGTYNTHKVKFDPWEQKWKRQNMSQNVEVDYRKVYSRSDRAPRGIIRVIGNTDDRQLPFSVDECNDHFCSFCGGVGVGDDFNGGKNGGGGYIAINSSLASANINQQQQHLHQQSAGTTSSSLVTSTHFQHLIELDKNQPQDLNGSVQKKKKKKIALQIRDDDEFGTSQQKLSDSQNDGIIKKQC